MNTTGRAKGPGPHRTHVRETQKRGVVRQARKGFTVRCFWVAARDWPCRVHRQTKGGFVSSGPRIPAKVRPVSFGPFVRTCSHPPAPAAAGIAFLGPRIVPVRDAWGHTRPRPAPRRPASCSTARALVRGASWRPQAGKARPPRKGRSAPGPREALRDQIVAGVHAVHRDRGKRPPIGVGAKPRNRHPPARQQPRKGNPRGFARGKVATQAYDRRRSWHLGLSGNSGASILAMRTRSRPQRIVSPSWTEGARQRAAAARTIGVGWSLAPSPARANQPCRLPHWPRSSPAGPASMPASLGGRRCESADDPP